jgi:hypothetical protein
LFHPFRKEEKAMKKSYLVTVVAGLLALVMAACAFALEPTAIRESLGDAPGGAPPPCLLPINTNGSAANLSWYNVCSGYIWIFSAFSANEQVGTHFPDAAVNDGNDIKRTITYFRNVVPSYNQTVDIYVDLDNNQDGCPEANILSDLNLDPGLRWNCSEFAADIPCQTSGLVVRISHDGGAAPTIATDGARQDRCVGPSNPNSWYYGIGGTVCLGWVGPDGTRDNFLTWLILDDEDPCPGNANESKSWGNIKGLYK